MIIAERKPLEEIQDMLAGYKKVLVVGCRTCTTICWAGGEKEVGILSAQFKLASSGGGNKLSIMEATVERQCEKEMVLEELSDKVPEVDAILSIRGISRTEFPGRDVRVAKGQQGVVGYGAPGQSAP